MVYRQVPIHALTPSHPILSSVWCVVYRVSCMMTGVLFIYIMCVSPYRRAPSAHHRFSPAGLRVTRHE
jgi:hypothetical protein